MSKMIQSGEFNILDLMNLAEVVYKIAKNAKDLFSDLKGIFGTGITLTNNEIKDYKSN